MKRKSHGRPRKMMDGQRNRVKGNRVYKFLENMETDTH